MPEASALRIATWNVNGLRARIVNVTEWLRRSGPDIVLLQETKVPDEQFPRESIEDAGYNIAAHGQKGFNGVAILSKFRLEDVETGLPGDDSDTQARWMAATIFGDGRPVRVCSLYVPNGNPVPSEKYDYKLAWMERLRIHAGELRATEMAVVMGGDYNVIPEAEDAYSPDSWLEDALYLPETRAAWRRLAHAGWTDALRALHPEAGVYSFWDYKGSAWKRDHGIRIDHLMLSPQAADRLREAEVEREERGRPKPSDHTPVWCTLAP